MLCELRTVQGAKSDERALYMHVTAEQWSESRKSKRDEWENLQTKACRDAHTHTCASFVDPGIPSRKSIQVPKLSQKFIRQLGSFSSVLPSTAKLCLANSTPTWTLSALTLRCLQDVVMWSVLATPYAIKRPGRSRLLVSRRLTVVHDREKA